jgi:hypothetical protein
MKKKMKKMKNELEFDVRRMLTLIESESGNIKPIIVEGESYIDEYNTNEELYEADDESSDATKKLSRVELGFEEMGCKRPASKNDLLLPGESDGSWGTIGPDVLKAIDQPQQTIIKNGDKAITMKCDGYDLLVTNHKSPNDQNQLVVLQVQKDKEGKKTYYISQKEFPGLLARAEAYVADEANLNAEQLMVLNNLLGQPGIKKTETTFTKGRPTGAESNQYEAVDLATGKGVETGTQYLDIDILKPDSLDQAFKREGRYFLWARRAVEAVGTDVVGDVEKMLSQIGFTADRNKLPDYQGPTDTRVTQATTLSQYCAGGKCDGYPDIITYIQKFGGGDTPIYPKTASREEAQVALNVGKRATKKAMDKIAKEGATKRTCRAIINIFDNVINNNMNDDNDIARVVSAAGYQTNAGGVPDIMTQLGSILENCAENWRGINFNKRDTRKLQGFASSAHKYAPNAAKVQAAAAEAEKEDATQAVGTPSDLAESISKSIRKVLKEHTKPNSDDIIKKSIRKNLRRFL